VSTAIVTPAAAATADISTRADLRLIAQMIGPGSRVLDVGCGDGGLLAYLVREKQVDGRGIELSQSGVNACVRNGLSVIQGDADTDLEAYPDAAFDFVILSQTLQAVYEPRSVLEQLLRIGRRAIVSFPNFGYWRVRMQLLFGGRMPMTGLLDDPWYATPNIHLCTIRDFVTLCREMGVVIEDSAVLDRHNRKVPLTADARRANLCGEQAVFLLRGRNV